MNALNIHDPKSSAYSKKNLLGFYFSQRATTEKLCKGLAIEDYLIQSMEDVSPPKWHLAHTTWFFETFVLIPHCMNYRAFDSSFYNLFNSYYQGLGDPYPRKKRGLLSRPTVAEVYQYRRYVDKYLAKFITKLSEKNFRKLISLLILGINHEQQHQELLLMDIKHNFSIQPNFPIYKKTRVKNIAPKISEAAFVELDGGVVHIGRDKGNFCFDNELPKHQQILNPYALSLQLVSNAEYCEFIDAGGYQNACWWLADGWECVQKNNWNAPLYWYFLDNKWFNFTLSGLVPLNPHAPVVHVSYYEADAYARWRKKRLPTEAEWEHYVSTQIKTIEGNFLESELYHPKFSLHSTSHQFFGDVWEWTASSYSPYPGYQPLKGLLSEYNGKFMTNQMVLKGGSCVTPRTHIRSTYRNFFQPDKRWQFSGIRLAADGEK